MFELNDAERRALRTAATLIVLAATARAWTLVAADPPRWERIPPDGASGPGAAAVEDAVTRGLERESRALTPLAPGETLDPNVAPEEELRRMPGVGPALAREIIEERERLPYRTAVDLERVPGIGPATARRLEPYLAFTGPSAGPGPPATTVADRRGAGSSSATSAPTAAGPDGALVAVNRADVGALQTLPGIGPAKARAIVETRARLGPFRSPEDLLVVPGIGSVTLERIRPRIRVP